MDLVTLIKQWKTAYAALLKNENGYTRDAFDCADSDLFHYLQDNCGENSEKMHHDITGLLEVEVSILRSEVTTMKLESLKKEATKSCKRRNHKMGAWVDTKNSAHCQCLNCGAFVQVVTRPLPNDIHIGGTAVALQCNTQDQF